MTKSLLTGNQSINIVLMRTK